MRNEVCEYCRFFTFDANGNWICDRTQNNVKDMTTCPYASINNARPVTFKVHCLASYTGQLDVPIDIINGSENDRTIEKYIYDHLHQIDAVHLEFENDPADDTGINIIDYI